MASQTLETLELEWITSLEEDLTCPVCLEVFVDPITLCCGHTLCKQCSHKLNHGGTQNYPLPSLSCPLCNVLFSSLQHFGVNVFMRNLCKDYKDRLQVIKSNIGERLKTPIDYCKDHLQEELKFVCMDCRVTFCGTCSAIEKKHVSHEVVSRDGAVEPVKRLFYECLQRHAVVNEHVEKSSSELTTSIQDLTATEESLKAFGNNLKAQFASLVDRRIDSFLDPLEKTRKEQIQLVNGKIKSIKNELEQLKSDLRSEINFQNVLRKVSSFAPILESLSNLESECNEAINISYSRSVAKFPRELNEVDLDKLHNMVREIFMKADSSDQTITSSEARQSDGIRCESADSQGSTVCSAIPNFCNNGTPLPVVEVRLQRISESSAACYNLDNIAWIDNCIIVAGYNDPSVYCIDFNNWKARPIFTLDSGTVRSVSAQIRQDTILLAINVSEGIEKNVLLLQDNRRIMSHSDPKWDREQKVRDIGLKPVSVCNNVMAYVYSKSKVCVVDISDHNLQPIWKSNLLQYPTEVVLGNKGTSSIMVYVKSKNKHKSKRDVLRSFNVKDSNVGLCYDTAKLKHIACFSPDKNGNLWVADNIQKLLVCFHTDGSIKHVLSHGSLCNICSIHVGTKDILLLCKDEEVAYVSSLPLGEF